MQPKKVVNALWVRGGAGFKFVLVIGREASILNFGCSDALVKCEVIKEDNRTNY
jgi:hypothetical protein